MIVVDLGCADRGEWYSLESLATIYEPDVIYGFDPSPSLNTRRRKVCGVPVELVRKAAWTHDGTVNFDDSLISGRGDRQIGFMRGQELTGSRGRIGTIGEGDVDVPCFDFSAWLGRIGPCVVKMDVEGAEYDLLAKLLDDGRAGLIRQLIVEWHDVADEALVARLGAAGVPVVGWWM